MRPGQNKRMRGRNNNNNGGNRRGPNPLTRSYESNGPDVKIRGTAQHIGEKYLQLARDAQTSGDPVAAENFLQHAEHYFRIIAAAQQAQQQAQVGYVRQPGETEADDVEGDDDVVMPDRFALPSERFPAPSGTGQQPYADRAGFNGERVNNPNERGNGQERYDRQERGENPYRTERQDRDQRPERTGADRPTGDRPNTDRPNAERQASDRGAYDRPSPERNDFDRDRQQRNDRPDRNAQRQSRYSRDNQDYRGQRNDRDPQGGRDQRDGRDPQFREQPRVGPEPQPEVRVQPPEDEAGSDLPAFITAPVRVAAQPSVTPPMPESDAPTEASQPVQAVSAEDSQESTENFAVRPRRRRRTRAMIDAEAAAADTGADPTSE